MKVLQFASYPVSSPCHGGQLRVAALNDELRKAGIDARVVSCFDVGLYSDCGKYDFPVPSSSFSIRSDRRPWDVYLSETVLDTPETMSRFERMMLESAADVYVFEQPWLWLVVRSVVAKHPELKRPIVYSSQNVEFRLLQDMKEPQGMVNMAYELEKELVEAADLVIACTDDDLNFYRGVFSVKRGIRFSNGISPHGPLDDALVRRYSVRYRGLVLAGFVGSAHPPNVDGFFRMLGTNLGYLSPNQKIVLVGGVAESVRWQSRGSLYEALNDSRCDYLGKVPQPVLEAVLSLCKVMVLPIIVGGGSNLKTAEALTSGKAILATSNAFRGYSDFLSFPNVHIEDDPRRMREKLVRLLSAPDVVLDDNQRKLVEQVYWSNILAGYPDLIKGLATR